MPVYTKASRARLAARMGYDDEPANPEGDDEDFTLLWRGPSSVPPSSRSSAPPPSRSTAPPPASRRERASAAPPPRVDRPTPTQLAPPPPPPSPPAPSFPLPARPEMRAQAALAQPEPPRILELTVHERRWRVIVRASFLLGIGCILGIGTEVALQRRGTDALPDPSMTSASIAMPRAMSSPIGTSSMPIAPAATQCVNAAASSPAPAPSGAASDESAAAARAVRHHHHRPADAPQPSAGSAAPAATPDGTIDPDDIAAAAEALSKAKQETMLP